MVCWLFGVKPLHEPMLVYLQPDSWEQISVKFGILPFSLQNSFEVVVWQNGGHLSKRDELVYTKVELMMA